MLPAAHRMRRPADFASVIRGGRRAGSRRLVVHRAALTAGDTAGDAAALVGLVVSKTVGSSVVRHRVSRQLRAQVRPCLLDFPPGSGTVIRALPAAGGASSAELARDLQRALARL